VIVLVRRNTPAKEFERYVRRTSMSANLKNMILGLHLSEFTPTDISFLVGYSDWPQRVPDAYRAEAEARFEIARKALVTELIDSASSRGLRSITLDRDKTGGAFMTLAERKDMLVALERIVKELTVSIGKTEGKAAK
jgi:hypothetical protein